MNKKLFFLAIAALGLAACSNDDVVEINQSLEDANTINFRPLVNNTTRATTATDVNLTNISPFAVSAYTNGNEASTAYIDNVTYTTDNNGQGVYYVGGSSTAAGQYYWPTANLDFFAYKTSVSTEIVRKAYNMFDITPTATASNPTTQGDFVFAALSNVGKTQYGASGVPLNFKHAETKISIKLKNSQSSLDFDVQAWKIVNVKNSGRFTYAHGELTSDKATVALTNGMWSDLSTGATPAAAANTSLTSYTSIFTKNISGSLAEASDLDNSSASIGSMILIPQAITSCTAYSGSTANDAIETGSYIAVKMIIKNHANSVVIADATQDVVEDASTKNNWAIWPVPAITWAPGKHYTYTIDLGDGGYWELNKTGEDDGLDAILDNSVIKFANVSVEEWSDHDADPNTGGNQPIEVDM